MLVVSSQTWFLAFLLNATQLLGEGFDLGDLLDLIAGSFALFLFAASLYAWYRRRQRTLLLVSAAFLLFFVRILIEVQPIEGVPIDISGVVLQFLALALFFLAVVLKPRPSTKSEEQKS